MISILIPTYNRKETLPGSLGSALPQLCEGDEVIVVDDGSTDETREVLEKYLMNSQVRYFRKEHTNAPDARNFALKKAKNDWVLWLDSDDFLAAETVEIYKKYVNKFSHPDVFYGDLEVFGRGERERIHYKDYEGKNQKLAQDLLRSNCLPNPGVLVRKRLYETLGGYDTGFDRAHDYDFWCRISAWAIFKHVGEVVCHWRWHESGISTNSSPGKYQALALQKYLRQQGLRFFFSDAVAGNLEIAKIFESCGDYESSRGYLTEAFEISRSKTVCLEIVQFAIRHHENRTSFSEKFQNALRASLVFLEPLAPQNLSVLYALGSFWKREGNLDKAGSQFQSLLDKERSDYHPKASFHLGEISFQKEMFSEAKRHFSDCLQFIPDHQKAKRYLLKLQESKVCVVSSN